VIIGSASEPLVRTADHADTHEASASAHTPEHESPSNAEPEANAAPAPDASLTLSAGDSGTIHDPHAPTAVGLRVGSICHEGATVDVTGRGAPAPVQGNESVTVVLPAGRYRYVVHCVENGRLSSRARSSGHLTIAADSGRGEMPSNAPRSTIDTDGRRYSVLYQNLLPEITAQWPSAPGGGPFTLNVRDAGGRTRTYRGAGTAVTVASGQLAEGSYRVWMSNPTGQRSIDTVLVIGFDNAARTAQLSEPHDPVDLSHGSVHVAGSALAGSSVTVGEHRLALDAQNRFQDTVPVSAGQASLVVRIAHPAHGVQYYLRRPATASR
jgi:hypothetical protein